MTIEDINRARRPTQAAIRYLRCMRKAMDKGDMYHLLDIYLANFGHGRR